MSLQLQQHGYIPRGGQIVDASIVQAPLTQANKDERQALNEGRRPEGWSAKRLRHTDRDARWTKKHGKSFYGYKVHANTDARYKLIRRVKVTPANVDDGQTLKEVLERANTGARVLADRGYDAQTNMSLTSELSDCSMEGSSSSSIDELSSSKVSTSRPADSGSNSMGASSWACKDHTSEPIFS